MADDPRASAVSIFRRVFQPESATLSPEAAREILAIDFDPADKARMGELSARARAGTLTADEEAEAGDYELVGHLLNIMRSRARRSAGRHQDARASHPSGHAL